jgi:lipopolysaccharide export system protein LptA
VASAARTWLQRTTALILGAAVVTLAVMAVLRAREMKARSGPGLATPPVQDPGQSQAVGVGQEFEHRETVAGVPVFLLNSIRNFGLSSGWHQIEGVRLQLYHDGEPSALLTCDSASHNAQTRDTRLDGAVHLQLEDGGFVSTESGRFDAGARLFVTEEPVLFSIRGHVGRATRARFYLASDHLILDDGVLIRFANSVTLQAHRIGYERGSGSVVLTDSVRLEHAQGSVDCGRARLEVDPDSGRAVRILFIEDVTVTGRTPAGELYGWAERIVGDRDAADRWHVKALTAGPWVTLEMTGGEDFLHRSIETWELRSVVGEGGILNVRCTGAVCLREMPLEGPPRNAEAVNARVWFEHGQPADAELERNVVLSGDGLQAAGARARVSSSEGIVMVHAAPDGRERATLRSARGTVRADQVQLRRSTNRAEARGDVQGELNDVSLLGAEPGAQPEPLHFAAELLQVDDNGSVFTLRGGARAWQGQRLLLADEIRYRQTGEKLTATGHVRTTLPASELFPDAAEDQDVMVVARSLDYGRGDRQALYRGGVTYSDGERLLTAAQMTVRFDEGNQVESFEALGGVEMLDITTGRRMTGQRARRETASRIVELSGSPVQLTDANGNTVSGTTLTWDQASGRVAISGGPDAPTETIYYPENSDVRLEDLR